MILSVSDQAVLFMTTVAIGFMIGFVYDLFRIARKTIPHTHIMVQIEDLLFWLLVTLLMFYLMLNRNYGEIRFFSIAGAALGAVLYFCSASILVMRVSVAIISFVQKIVATVVRIVFAPVRMFLLPPAKWVLRVVVSYFRGVRRRLFIILKKV